MVAVAATAAATVAVRRVRGRRAADPRTHVLTVFRPIDDVGPAERLPGPLGELAAQVEVRLSPAPGERGTEIAVRVPQGSPVTAATVRRALRETRSLLETGDVLRPGGPPTTVPTLLNRPLRSATRHGRAGGLL